MDGCLDGWLDAPTCSTGAGLCHELAVGLVLRQVGRDSLDAEMQPLHLRNGIADGSAIGLPRNFSAIHR